MPGQRSNEKSKPARKSHLETDPDEELLEALKSSGIMPHSRKAAIPLAEQSFVPFGGAKRLPLDSTSLDGKEEGLVDAERVDNVPGKFRLEPSEYRKDGVSGDKSDSGHVGALKDTGGGGGEGG